MFRILTTIIVVPVRQQVGMSLGSEGPLGREDTRGVPFSVVYNVELLAQEVANLK